MSYLATIMGFVGADPEQRQARNNGSKYTVLSVATQRSWKNAQDACSSKTEWQRICRHDCLVQCALTKHDLHTGFPLARRCRRGSTPGIFVESLTVHAIVVPGALAAAALRWKLRSLIEFVLQLPFESQQI